MNENNAVLPTADINLSEIKNRIDSGIPPADAYEYLARVKYEANQLPDVVESDVNPENYRQYQTANMPRLDNIQGGVCFEEEWKCRQKDEFAEVRQFIARADETRTKEPRRAVPKLKDVDGWRHFCFGNETTASGHPPLLSLLLQFDQLLTKQLLDYHAEWLESSLLSQPRAAWLYALMARIAKPLDPDIEANLRRILRRCHTLRSSNPDGGAKGLDLIICITGDYFGQNGV